MKVVFRTDASQQIGTGHVIRCLTLAKALRAAGVTCQFICREHPGHLLDLIRGFGFTGVGLPIASGFRSSSNNVDFSLAHASWLGSEQQTDAAETIAALGDAPIDWMVVDHYALDQRWENSLRPYAKKIMAIDDLADRSHDCDVLLDQNLVEDMEHRYDGLVPGNCTRLLGPTYALLQPDYLDLYPRTPPRLGPVRRILVFFGGADSNNLTGMALAAFVSLDCADLALDVVIHPESPHFQSVSAQAKGNTRITMHQNLPSLAELIVKADLAVGAAGATSWERCCLGLPTLVVTLAEHQRPIAAALEKKGLVRWLGHVGTVKTESIKQAMQQILRNEDLAAWSHRCRDLVDGQGASRLATLFSLEPSRTLKVRLAGLEDERLLLRWANEPAVRRNSFHPEPIAREVHQRWFYERLRNMDNCQIYIGESEAGLPVGQVRFDRQEDGWEIDLSLAVEARGVGLGKRLLEAAMLELRKKQAGVQVFGRVKPENTRSCRIFEELGFEGRAAGGGGGMLLYH
jgi:UDP-2,4-diacetamido-2,4,6-trideoxy-beta-L-altropyranose hydrolase